jgi:UDP:flavonoid glycosyltransferase YjiC (YdhE family)
VIGELPSSWLVREFLPQVAILQHSTLAVTHGGNNSVTEALTCGVPMLVMPFSTDQFAGAEAVEACGAGTVLDPNSAAPGDIRSALDDLLAGESVRVAGEFGAQLRDKPGRQRAWEAMMGGDT